jgi:uncharacterized integral membrane protein
MVKPVSHLVVGLHQFGDYARSQATVCDDLAMTYPEDPQVQPASDIAVPAEDRTKKLPKKKIETTRVSYAWLGLVLGALLTIVMLVFILQNLDSVRVSFLAWGFEIPTGIAMLLSAVAGALITAFVGGVRILQVKRAARRS